jgi:hypothetical protein
MRDTSDYVAAFGLIVILALGIWAAVITDRAGHEQCQAMIALAKTRADTLTVYGMKPHAKYVTCYDRLN